MSVLHLVAFPHTRLDGGYTTCAYTQKVAKFRRMNLGRDLIVYGCEGADVQIGDATRPDDGSMPSWPDETEWETFNRKAVTAINERASSEDILLLAGGYSQHKIAEALPALTACEPGVGYEGITTPFCAFESYAWMHHVYGLKAIRDGRWFDTVIPNYFDPADSHLGSQTRCLACGGSYDACARGEICDCGASDWATESSGDYLLFLGRVTARKGPHVAAEIAAAAGTKLIIAGPGVVSDEPGRLVGDGVEIIGDHVQYVGQVDAIERADLLAGSRALIAPTLYVEPFGGVAVEAMFAGTPVIATDWGAFTETVEDGVTGYRIRTLADAVAAVKNVDALRPTNIRNRAMSRYSLEAVAPMFVAWFIKLDSLHHRGWYDLDGTPSLSPSSRPPTMAT